MDILALTNIAKNIIGRNLSYIQGQLGLSPTTTSANDILLGHYLEGMDATGAVETSYTANTQNKAGDKIMSWLQGDYTSNQKFEGEATQQRYLFSDYATGLGTNGQLRDDPRAGIKLRFNSTQDPNDSSKRIVSEVIIAINPRDGGNGSGPLAVRATLSTDNSDTSWSSGNIKW